MRHMGLQPPTRVNIFRMKNPYPHGQSLSHSPRYGKNGTVITKVQQ